MPELPDLQVFAGNLNKALKGKTIEKVNVLNDSKLKTPVADFKRMLVGKKLLSVYREGKELHFALSDKTILGLHLMLHGNLYIYYGKNDHAHSIIEIEFNGGTGLALTDWQGNAMPTLNPQVRSSPDALSTKVTAAWMKKKLEGRKAAIKNILLDQDVIRGIGNAYADEILWVARIFPFSIAANIPGEKIGALVRAIKSVLKNAEKQIKKEYPDKLNGEYRDFLLIHNAKKKESPTGAKIRSVLKGGRKTYYTEEQVEY